MPTPALEAKVRELGAEAWRENHAERHFEELQERAEQARDLYENAREKREALEGASRRERKERLPEVCRLEDRYGERAEEARKAAEAVQAPSGEARRAHRAARKELAERERSELLAIRLRPPAWVLKELGERPSDPDKARTWDRGVGAVQSWRRERGITDATSALGKRPESWAGRSGYENAQRRLRDAQRKLGLQHSLGRERSFGREIGRWL